MGCGPKGEMNLSRNGYHMSNALKMIRGTAMPISSSAGLFEWMGVSGTKPLNLTALPFSLDDTTAGNETELQTVVSGDRTHVDLPITIEGSNYFANILRRTKAGELRKTAIHDLERWIDENQRHVWENSWVRFPADCLDGQARQVLEGDLLLDKDDPGQGRRTDADRFLFQSHGRPFLRLPVSYLLKLALADVVDPGRKTPALIAAEGQRLMSHFLSDNTSPETYSFHVMPLHRENGMGQALARETAKRFLLTQLLAIYANKRFLLEELGQVVTVFFSPHPPIRQKKLNACISDAFYRELFMNPCLSGWPQGEAKQAYMHLCHQVLSRSQLNAVLKLREAGIINTNLVVLPSTSNISLANNGVHISLGSRKLTALMENPASGYTAQHEKYVGDLAIKILEHFIPLFVGTYSAAPYRLDFTDFHPEKVLGFLPHELDYTHLRMFWRRWQKKAKMKILGQAITPFGPPLLDKLLSSILRLKGDYIPDYRLIDYLVALMSTEKSPALDGILYNQERLKEDLADLGIFDRHMSIYSFLKLREYGHMGFSGFECRYYSLFPDFGHDMAQAVNLQNLLHALAFKYMAEGLVSHTDIPDDPFIESERRQIVFGCAVSLPTFFIRQDTRNAFLKRIVLKAQRIRPSQRYPGYLRVHHQEYTRALVQIIREDAADLIELFHMGETIDNLAQRIDAPDQCGAFGRLQADILKTSGIQSPLSLPGEALNRAAEDFYRNDLRKRHFMEAWHCFMEDVAGISRRAERESGIIRTSLHSILKSGDPLTFLSGREKDIYDEKISADDLETIIRLLILTLFIDKNIAHFPADQPAESLVQTG